MHARVSEHCQIYSKGQTETQFVVSRFTLCLQSAFQEFFVEKFEPQIFIPVVTGLTKQFNTAQRRLFFSFRIPKTFCHQQLSVFSKTHEMCRHASPTHLLLHLRCVASLSQFGSVLTRFILSPMQYVYQYSDVLKENISE